jgi:hypothetical protein
MFLYTCTDTSDNINNKTTTTITNMFDDCVIGNDILDIGKRTHRNNTRNNSTTTCTTSTQKSFHLGIPGEFELPHVPDVRFLF